TVRAGLSHRKAWISLRMERRAGQSADSGGAGPVDRRRPGRHPETAGRVNFGTACTLSTAVAGDPGGPAQLSLHNRGRLEHVRAPGRSRKLLDVLHLPGLARAPGST